MSKLFQTVKRAGKEFSDDDITTYAAAVSYQVFFSLFPFVIFMLTLFSFLRIPGSFDTLLSQTSTLLTGQASGLLERVVGEILLPPGKAA